MFYAAARRRTSEQCIIVTAMVPTVSFRLAEVYPQELVLRFLCLHHSAQVGAFGQVDGLSVPQ
jgi:hypothetical protein